GGHGGEVLWVTRLDDDVKKAPPGSLRWALRQKGPRVVKFSVGGVLTLKDRIEVKESRLTLDGTDAPGEGITIRGGSLEFSGVEDIILRNLRVRLGDETVLRKNRAEKRKRPKSSNGLDCITLKDCNRVLVDHCSLSWSCDELIGITHCQNVTVQWCILGEPLGRPELHPYGDDHAFGINASASSLSIHHCLFARFVMRGPQFECNDMRPKDRYTVQMEAVNNVIFDYQRSGSRYSTGVEKGSGTGEGKKFEFQFLNNLYVTAGAKRAPIEAFTRHGFAPGMKAAVVGNEMVTGSRQKVIAGVKLPAFSIKGPHLNWPMVRPKDEDAPTLAEELAPSVEPSIPDSGRAIPIPEKAVTRRLFAAPVPVRPEPVAISWRNVLNASGAGPVRDEVDARIMRDVEEMTFRDTLRSQKEVGGWP
ncbi:MAG TPA: hypothetical protein VK956_08680, partial [Verrucomicrobium sp.]|nr:hypothetical protein [Verrucomicrobium sp.]